jgi:ATP-binding cassette subfamily B protein
MSITLLSLSKHTSSKKLVVATALSILNKILITLPEFFFGLAIDVILNTQQPLLTNLGVTGNSHQLIFLAGCIALIWLLASLVYYFEILIWQGYAQALQHNLRMHLYACLQKHPVLPKKIGNVVSIINDDINHIEHFFRFAAHEAIHLIVGTLIIGGIYFYCAPLIGIIALVPLPFVVMLSIQFHNKLQLQFLLIRNQAGTIATHITQDLTAEKLESLKLEKESLRYHDIALATAHTNALFNPLINMVIAVGIIGTLLVSGYYTLQGQLSPGMFSIIFLQTQRLLWPFARTAQLIDAYERTVACVVRIKALMEAPAETFTDTVPENELAQKKVPPLQQHPESFSEKQKEL